MHVRGLMPLNCWLTSGQGGKFCHNKPVLRVSAPGSAVGDTFVTLKSIKGYNSLVNMDVCDTCVLYAYNTHDKAMVT